MAWSTSDRRARLPADWPHLRQATKARARGICEWVDQDGRCTEQGTDCDHVVQGDDHSLANLQWLCGPHHDEKTRNENAARNRQTAALRRKPTEPHPGRTR